MTRSWIALIACVVFAASCSAPTGPAVTHALSMDLKVNGVDGRVVWADFEGGFWMIETSDGRRLDPHPTIPEAFRTEGLLVRVAARKLTGFGCYHMAGTLVEITAIHTR